MRGFFILIIAILWIIAIYLGYITIVGKSMHSESKEEVIDMDRLEREQALKAQDIWEQQKRLMEERQRRIPRK